MNGVNVVKVLQQDVRSRIPKGSDFDEEWHGQMGMLYDVEYHGGNMEVLASYGQRHLESLISCNLVRQESGRIAMTDSGKYILKVYMASLDRKLKEIVPIHSRRYETNDIAPG